MALLFSSDVSMDMFIDLVRTHPWSDETLLMAFTPVQALFTPFRFDDNMLSQTEQGRIFSSRGELKWRLLINCVRVVYLGDKPGPAMLSDYSSELDGLSSSQRQFILWGQRSSIDPSEWLEQQIPHRFRYPLYSKLFSRGRIALVVEDWIDQAGLPRFSRYHSLIEIEGGN